MAETISIIVGVLAMVLGVISIIISYEARNTSKENRTEAASYYEKTKDLLHEIDKRSATMEEKVSDNFKNMMDTQSDLITKTIIPQTPSMEEKMGMAFMTKLFESPQGMEAMTKLLQQEVDAAKKNE